MNSAGTLNIEESGKSQDMMEDKKGTAPPPAISWADDVSPEESFSKSSTTSAQDLAHGPTRGVDQDASLDGGQGAPLSAAETLSVPLTQTTNRRTRSASPARITGPISSRIFQQEERLEMLGEFAQSVVQAHDQEVTLSHLNMWEARIGELFDDAKEANEFISDRWPSGNLNHPYFTEGLFRRITSTRNNTLMAILGLKRRLGLTESALSSSSTAGGSKVSAAAKLPKLDLPTFSGAYYEWPRFAQLFNSLVLEPGSIAEVHKLQYLKLSLEGEPAQLISAVPLQEGKLKEAWDTLTARYEDKGRVIASYIERVLSLSPCTSSNQAELRKIYGVVSEAARTVKSLAAELDIGDIFWAHLMVRNLDPSLRRDLAFALGSTKVPYSYDKVEEYVRGKLRALETTDPPQGVAAPKKAHGSTQPTAQQRGSALQTTAQGYSSSRSAYACDCCQGSHYISACSSFLHKNAKDRRSLVVEKRLCFNCLGRHSARACRNAQLCKTCKGKHHTLLHEASVSAQPATTQGTAQQGTSSTSQ